MFASANSVANPTLNVNGTGAQAIFANGVNLAVKDSWKDNQVIDFVYDGFNWHITSLPNTMSWNSF
jgi:hypothetical protein